MFLLPTQPAAGAGESIKSVINLVLLLHHFLPFNFDYKQLSWKSLQI